MATVAVAALLGATLPTAPAHAAGGFTAEYGAGDPLHGLGAYNLSTYVTADLDGDGDLDVVAREHASDAAIDYFRNDSGAFTMLAGGANPFAGIAFAAQPANFLNTRVLVGDFDTDGDVDLWHHGVGFAAFYRNDGATFSAHFGAADPLAALAARDPGTYVVADVDGDSDADVVARNAATDASIDLLRNDSGTFVTTTTPFAGISFPASAANFVNTCVLVLDADGDGDVDLWHHGAGFAALYRNDGAAFSAHSGIDDPLHDLGGYDAHSYVTMDVDSDADLDVVAREPVTDVALDVLRNDGAGTFVPLTGGASPFAAVTLAVPDIKGTFLLLGDHDGDGDGDLYNQALNELYRQAGSAPVAGARSPARGATGAPVTGNLSLAFGEPVQLGAGAVVLRNATTGALLHRLDVGAQAARFSGAGTATITIDPPAPLPFATVVAVTVEPGAFVATADGDAFAGNAPTAWRFTTAANTAPGMSALDGDAVTYVEGAAPVALDAGAAATVVDADGIGFGGGDLSAAITSGAVPGEDHLAIGVIDGGVTVTTPLGGADDAGAVGGLLHAMTYTNDAGDDPTPGPRTITVTLHDGGGLAASATVTVVVQKVDDPPTISAPDRVDATAGVTVTVGPITVTDPDGGDGGLDLRAEVDVGSLAGGDPDLELTGTVAELSAALAALTWTSPAHAGVGTLSLTVDDGTTTASALVELHVSAPADDDPPARPDPDDPDDPAEPPSPVVARPAPPLLALPFPAPLPESAVTAATAPARAPRGATPAPLPAVGPAPGPIVSPDTAGARGDVVAARATPTLRPAGSGSGLPIGALVALMVGGTVVAVGIRSRRGVSKPRSG